MADTSIMTQPALPSILHIREAARFLDVSPSHLRDLEKRGDLGTIPRDQMGRREYSRELLLRWKESGIPGSAIAGPQIRTHPNPLSATDTNERPGMAPLPVVRPAVMPERPMDDALYQNQSNAVRRMNDELAIKRLEIERRRLDRELDADKQSGEGGSLVRALIEQNTILMTKLLETRHSPEDETARTLKMIESIKTIFSPVDLSSRPEGKVFERLANGILDKVLDRALGDGGGEEGSVQSILKALPGVVSLLTRGRENPAGGGAAVTGQHALPPAGVLDESQNEFLDGVEVVREIFDLAYQAQTRGLSVDEAVEMFAGMVVDGVPKTVKGLLSGPVDIVKNLARLYHHELYAAWGSPPSKVWYDQLIEELKFRVSKM